MGIEETLAPGLTTNYTWDDHSKPRVLKLKLDGKALQDTKLDAFSAFKPLQYQVNSFSFFICVSIKFTLDLKGKTIYNYVRVDGGTRVLCLTESYEKFVDEADPVEKNKNVDEIIQIEALIQLGGFGFSFIDSTPQVKHLLCFRYSKIFQEVLYVAITNVRLDFIQSNLSQNLQLAVGNFQVNSFHFYLPVLVTPCYFRSTINFSTRDILLS